ncbi:efflux RND transporter periplasmic adaptor subunit [Myxococcota bacterium]|nr:efflux RND transporter periplasmic adaptor subunit [Myxococcota bacterium]
MWILLALLACGDGASDGAPEGAPAGAPSGAATAAPPTAVRTLTLAPQEWVQTVTATGVVEVRDSVELRPETSGVITAIHFQDGQAVEQGALLVQLRDTDARAQVAEAEARLALAEVTLGRLQALVATDNAPRAEVDQAQAERDLAAAQVARAKEAVRRTRVVAPFAGVLGRRDFAVGATVDPARTLTRLDRLDLLVVDVSVSEDDAVAVVMDQPATVSVEAVQVEQTGRVRYVSPRARAGSRTVDVRVEVDDLGGRLRPGLSAAVRIEVGRLPDAVVVPAYAVIQGATGASAWVVGEGDKAEPRSLVLGGRAPDAVQVESGLAVGDRLILEGFTRLRPGAPVTEAAPSPGAGATPGAR